MPFTVKVDMPNLPKGNKVQVHGLGQFENGKAVKVSDEQAETFRLMNATPQKQPDGSTKMEPGPALDEANFPEGVTVTAEGQKASATSKEGSQ